VGVRAGRADSFFPNVYLRGVGVGRRCVLDLIKKQATFLKRKASPG
jgi:hypothetical protein